VVFGIGLVGHAFVIWRFLMDLSVLPRCLESPVIELLIMIAGTLERLNERYIL
jgi:hypothetical protein